MDYEVLAKLITLCGCTKEMWIPYPPRPQLEIPLQRPVAMAGDAINTEVFVRIRTFELHNCLRGPTQRHYKAEYRELWQK